MTVKDQDPKALRKLIAARLKLGTPVFLEKNGPGQYAAGLWASPTWERKYWSTLT
jgi:hypothetical protein